MAMLIRISLGYLLFSVVRLVLLATKALMQNQAMMADLVHKDQLEIQVNYLIISNREFFCNEHFFTGPDGGAGTPGPKGEPGKPGPDASYCKCPRKSKNKTKKL